MVFLLMVTGYLLGSIPSGLLLTKFAGLGDIRAIGSGNIGTTNVLRTGHKALAALTLCLDMGKGLAAVLIGTWLTPNEILPPVTGLCAVIGHMYPVWLKFRGGKGVATTFGVMLGLSPVLGLSMVMLWLGTALVFKISSLAALTAFAAAPVLAFCLLHRPDLSVLGLVIAALVFWSHRANIRRLIRGEETRIHFSKKEKG